MTAPAWTDPDEWGGRYCTACGHSEYDHRHGFGRGVCFAGIGGGERCGCPGPESEAA